MHEEIEYAEMLEIPVSTVNVVKKNSRRKKTKHVDTAANAHFAPQETLPATQNFSQSLSQNHTQNPLKETVIEKVNSKLNVAPVQSTEGNAELYPPEENAPFMPVHAITADADLFAESANSDGRLDFDPIPERIDTVRLYSTPQKRSFWDFFRPKDKEFSLTHATDTAGDYENTPWGNQNDDRNTYNNDVIYNGDYDGGSYGDSHRSKAVQIALNVEFAVACALCATIFLTNIFMPNSAINTFFRSMNGMENTATDTRNYADFTLSPVISDLSNAQLNLSPTGILSFTEEGCVYPAADGVVAAVEQEKDGTFLIKISHSDSFTGVIGGLDYVYYAVGDTVKCNVPVGYSEGEAEVQVTMYSQGLLLNCFELTEENCLAWVEEN